MNETRLKWLYAAGAIAFASVLITGILYFLYPEWKFQHRDVAALERNGCKVWLSDAGDTQSDAILTIDGATLKPSDAHLCGVFPKVFQLDISNCDDPEAYLSEIADPSRLIALRLTRCRITPGLFAKTKGIGELRLSELKVTDETVEQIGCLSRLEQLHLKDTSVTEDSLAKLVPLKTLNLLSIEGSSLSAKGCQHLSQLRLSQLNLERTKVSSYGVAEIVRMKTLNSITVSSTCVSASDIMALQAAFPIRYRNLNDGLPTVGPPEGVTVVP